MRAFTAVKLADPRHREAVEAAAVELSKRLAEVKKEIGQLEVLQKAISDRLGRREMTLDAFDAANGPLVADLAVLQAEQETLVERVEKAPVTGPARTAAAGKVTKAMLDAVLADWDRADIDERRSMLTNALGHLRLIVLPAVSEAGTRRRFTRDRIRMVDPDEGGDGVPLPEHGII